MSAHHGNRACAHAHQRIDAQKVGYADRQDILQDNEDDDLHQKQDQVLSALLEDSQIGLKSHGGEEKYHADLAERIVIDELDDPRHVKDAGNNGDYQSAYDRRGNTESLEQSDPFPQKLSEHQDADRNCKCKIFVDLDRQHSLPSLLTG